MNNLNTTIYIFGQLSSGYSQYPDDHTCALFQKFAQESGKGTPMVIHREKELMYYVFIKRLSDPHRYIGVCFVWNSKKCETIEELCKLCVRHISRWTLNGDLLEISEKGEIVSNTNMLYEKVPTVNLLTVDIQSQINNSSLVFSDLHPINYGNNKDEMKRVFLKDGDVAINEAVDNFTTVLVSSNLQSVSLNTAKSKLEKCYNENEALRQENEKLRRANKQTTLVSVLGGILAIVVFVLFAILSSSGQKSKKISQLNYEIRQLNGEVSQLEDDNSELQTSLSFTSQQLSMTNNQKDSLASLTSSLQQDLRNHDQIIESLQNEIDYYQIRVRNLQSEISQLKNRAGSSGETYEVYAMGGNKAYVYYQCGERYVKTDCYFSDFTKVTVYSKKDGYALTHGGFVRMMDLRK